MSGHFILDGKTPVASDDLMAWGRWMQGADRSVCQTIHGEVMVSTVFLGLDHSFGQGPPLLFETKVFGGPLDQEQERYSTWDEAERGHAEMVQRCRNAEAS